MARVTITVPNYDLIHFNALVERHDIALNCVGMNIHTQCYEATVRDSQVAMLLKLTWGGK